MPIRVALTVHSYQLTASLNKRRKNIKRHCTPKLGRSTFWWMRLYCVENEANVKIKCCNIKNYSWTIWPLKMGLMDYAETSVTCSKPTPRTKLEERTPRYHGRCLKYRILNIFCCKSYMEIECTFLCWCIVFIKFLNLLKLPVRTGRRRRVLAAVPSLRNREYMC